MKIPIPNASVLCWFILAVATATATATASDTNGLAMYQINNGNFSVTVTNYGARIVSVILPDNKGKLGDIVLGYDTIKEYLNDSSHFGAIVGRVANRISGAQFSLNGTTYKLDANSGNNSIHGGKKGFSEVGWMVKNHQKHSITLEYDSKDGEEGFPGEVIVSVTYALLKPYKLSIRMEGRAVNKATPVNLAQHSYWNLAGHNTGDILSHRLQLFASHITPTDSQNVPTGAITPVNNTPYDFLQPRLIKHPIAQLPKGYDINYAVDGGSSSSSSALKAVAVVYDDASGRMMKLWATAPGVQLFTANNLKDRKGKGGAVYQQHAALCLETQGFPDAVNRPNFPSTIVYPQHTYKHYMLFHFSTQN